MTIKELKQLAGKTAAQAVKSGMVVGLGTGSTAIHAVYEIGRRFETGDLTDIICIPTSDRTEQAAKTLGLPLTDLGSHPYIDITIDGADEVDPDCNLIKGGGGALLREKIVAQASEKLIIVADDKKLVPKLGTTWAVPIEVVPFGWESQKTFLETLGANVTLRLADGKPFLTDSNNIILDADFGDIEDVDKLGRTLSTRAGIVEHGLFLGMADQIIIASPDGLTTINKPTNKLTNQTRSKTMKLGMVGLGKMGGNMTRRLRQDGHEVIVSDLNADAVNELVDEVGAIGATDLKHLVSQLDAPRAVWLMLPAGKVTDIVIDQLKELLSEGDIIIDGANSNFNDTKRRAEALKELGIQMVDVGTSGGVWGLEGGYSMMVGGSKSAVSHITAALETLAPAEDKGWGHVGTNGAGHYTKMVHNGIEYALMQSYAEGFDLLRAKEEFDLDLHQVSEIWRYGSVIRSWLLDLTAIALSEDAELSEIDGYVSDSGMGRWTVKDSIDLAVPAPLITLALQMRFISRDDHQYWARLLSAMRNQFGGHAIKKATGNE